MQGHTADVYTLDLATDTVTPLVTQAGPRHGPALVARRIDDRVRVGDGPPGLLSRQRTHRRRGRVGRHAGIGHRRLRRRPEPDRLDRRAGSSSRACRRPPAICSSPIPRRRPSRASASPTRSSDLASRSRRTARRSRSAPRRRRRWRRSTRPAAPALSPRKLTDMTSQLASYRVGTARGRAVEEPGRHDDRGRAGAAGGFRPDEEVPAAVHHPRRPDRHRPARAAREPLLPRRRLGRPRRAGAEGELSRQRGLRREVPAAQRPQPRRRRRVGRRLGHRPPRRARAGSIRRASAAWAGARAATSRRS